ncbi:MAG: hypothetical protein F8N36_12155 [Desulfovibrio sp.]|uniref:hypothetical protein n=1 Tax=Desulfovibrio sp. TaxID=885 RepID=UPI00135F0E54|nr:hypothetical protein [Desulfovibrio sp.]MTJ93601.1 hypothetical protein [Desulfovibrio sp.]
MSRKAKEPAAIGRVEKDFLAAIERLVAGKPMNRDLAKRAKDGKLKINKATVAAEAGRSRVTLDRYENIVAQIETLGTEPITSADHVIARLREENAKLKQQRQAATDAMAAMLLRMRAMERSTDQEVRKALRRAARPQPNRIVGATGHVVAFPDGEDDAG